MNIKKQTLTKKDSTTMLMISNVTPYPLQSGDRIRVMALLKGLSKKFRIVFISLYEGTEDVQFVTEKLMKLSNCEKIILIPFVKSQVFSFLTSLLLFKSYRERLFYSRELRKKVEEELSSTHFDVVYQHFLAVYPELWKEAKKKGSLSVLDQHNIYKTWWLNIMKSDKKLFKRIIAAFEVIKEGFLEKRNLPEFDINICASGEEVDKTIKLGAEESRVKLGPNGADLRKDIFNLHPSVGESDEIVFCGSMDLNMNEDAVLYFLSEIYPLIRSQKPKVRMTIVGKKPASRIVKMHGQNGIDVTGTVPDVLPYLQRAGVIIAPFRQGAGTKLKILEALSIGKTIISTSLGCQGIEVIDGRDVLIADTPDFFAELVIRALGDVNLRRYIGLNATTVASVKYNWVNICDNIADAIYLALEEKSAG